MSIEHELQKELVIHLDLTKFTEVEPGTSVRETVQAMREAGNNCAFVTCDGQLRGIFTDRDILQKVVDNPQVWDQQIEEVMTPSPFTVNTNDEADAALALMNEKHFRNVPVLDNNGVTTGNLTHYAIIKYLADRFPESVYNLPPDPENLTSDRIGA